MANFDVKYLVHLNGNLACVHELPTPLVRVNSAVSVLHRAIRWFHIGI